MAEQQAIYNGLPEPAYLQNGSTMLVLQTAATQSAIGNSVLGNPSDGSYDGGAVDVTPTTLIADAFDRLNNKLADVVALLGATNGRIDAIATGSAATVVATCLSSVAPGDAVHVSSDGIIITAQAASPATLDVSPATGVVLSKAEPTTAVVALGGLVPGIYTNLVAGQTYVVGVAGKPSLPPLNLSGTYFMQPLGMATGATSLVLNIQPVRTRLEGP